MLGPMFDTRQTATTPTSYMLGPMFDTRQAATTTTSYMLGAMLDTQQAATTTHRYTPSVKVFASTQKATVAMTHLLLAAKARWWQLQQLPQLRPQYVSHAVLLRHGAVYV